MVVSDYVPKHYKSMLSRIRSSKVRAIGKREYCHGTLETFMSLGLGSGVGGSTINQLPCGNSSASRGQGSDTHCQNPGILACSRCLLVKYCSGQCQRQHWVNHRTDCNHPFLDPAWQPAWVKEEREPNYFHVDSETQTHMKPKTTGNLPAADCLQLGHNEGVDINRDFKICFAASGDIRSLIQTVNGLPKAYKGKCDILLNDMDAIVVNRNLVILYALLSSGPSIEESAELATHLMYSAALPAASAAYLRGCIRMIYGDGAGDGDMSFQTCLKTRGVGRLLSMQTTMGIKRPVDMFLSTYELRKGIRDMRRILLDPLREDERDRSFISLKPAHRIALMQFWKYGILAPFSLDLRPFVQPNRLLFSMHGEWLGQFGANPLHGWDVSKVQASGSAHGMESSDILGCLFFHVKRELMEFARRMKEFRIDIHLTQFDPQVLSKGISIGALPAFKEGCLDRVETSNLVDYVDIRECLMNWAPLLNRRNRYASILMHSKHWYYDQPGVTAQTNPHITEMLIKRYNNFPGLESRLRDAFSHGSKSPAVLRLIESLDAFVDHEAAFQEYLRTQAAEPTAEVLGLRLRTRHRVHPRRFGVPLGAFQQKLPDLSRNEFYDLFTIGGAEFPARFVEFEGIPTDELYYEEYKEIDSETQGYL